LESEHSILDQPSEAIGTRLVEEQNQFHQTPLQQQHAPMQQAHYAPPAAASSVPFHSPSRTAAARQLPPQNSSFPEQSSQGITQVQEEESSGFFHGNGNQGGGQFNAEYAQR
jgi:hypothetical protein